MSEGGDVTQALTPHVADSETTEEEDFYGSDEEVIFIFDVSSLKCSIFNMIIEISHSENNGLHLDGTSIHIKPWCAIGIKNEQHSMQFAHWTSICVYMCT